MFFYSKLKEKSDNEELRSQKLEEKLEECKTIIKHKDIQISSLYQKRS